MENYLDQKGRIFNVQKFSVHDGPGIRTIIFLKGCFLRCKWCCNPESQSHEIQQMTVGGVTKTVGEDVTVREVMEKIMRDRVYYRRSGGGVTLSGGEMLFQPEFSSALLRACKENGISTAVESTACASFDKIEKCLPYIDYYLMDIKHTNSEKHKQFTGQPNELILENAKKIAKSDATLIIRVPVIPTFNDTVEEITDIAKFAKTLDGVEELHLLPYHAFGSDKYKGLGRKYLMEDIVTPTNEKMEQLKSAVENCGLKCQIGG
ncbi:MAG: glycyl-radical enzyme activating protein [Clostridia bacterium]|nr:glycyl-radical enzyme activating protein [Clostridia bacterium]MBQ9997545.1 glycyl-radical enzyme activating protein [Clostridia bacterium]